MLIIVFPHPPLTARLYFGENGESLGELLFEMLDAAKTAELPVHHDAQSVAQRLALLHTGDRQD